MILETDFGFRQLGFAIADFLKPGYISQLGYPPLRIDVRNEIDGVNYDEAAANMIFCGISRQQADDSIWQISRKSSNC
jgi:hypothetical protein